MFVERNLLLQEIEQFLNVNAISDYCPNGLQVEGKAQIKRIVSGVTASQALIDAAIELQADAILVHHGYFWKGEDQRVIGMKQRRIKALLTHDINLDRKSTRLNSSHVRISYAVSCLKKKTSAAAACPICVSAAFSLFAAG